MKPDLLQLPQRFSILRNRIWLGSGTYFTSETRTTIHPPTPDAALRCLGWLPSPVDFIRGRRASIGRSADVLTDAEILPGIDSVGTGRHADVDVELTVEVIRLDD